MRMTPRVLMAKGGVETEYSMVLSPENHSVGRFAKDKGFQIDFDK